MSKDNSTQIKGMAILCMIIFHLFGFPNRIPNDSILSLMGSPITKAFQICVPIYLFMAGYGLQCVATKGTITWQSIGKRLSKLYVSYWWVAVPFIAMGYAIGYYAFETLNLLYNFSGLTASYNGEWWFFSLYVELLILFYFVSRIKLGWKGYLLLMIGILFFTRALNSIVHLNEVVIVERHVKMILINLNIFMLGCFFAKFDVFGWLHTKCTYLFDKQYIAILLLIIPIGVRAYIPLIGITELIIVPIFVIGIINSCKSRVCGKILHFFGKHSTNLWLTHSFFIYYYLKDITFLTNNPLVMFLTVIGCSLGCSIAIQFFKIKFIYNS